MKFGRTHRLTMCIMVQVPGAGQPLLIQTDHACIMHAKLTPASRASASKLSSLSRYPAGLVMKNGITCRRTVTSSAVRGYRRMKLVLSPR